LAASEPVPPSENAASGSGGSAKDTEPAELAFWQSVEASDDPKEYQAYLKQFPEGAFAVLAKTRLAGPAGMSPSTDHSVELEFWNSIKDTDVRENFEAYLKKYPEGEFSSLAEIRFKALTDGDRAGSK
jgi:TolA-binding protein